MAQRINGLAEFSFARPMKRPELAMMTPVVGFAIVLFGSWFTTLGRDLHTMMPPPINVVIFR